MIRTLSLCLLSCLVITGHAQNLTPCAENYHQLEASVLSNSDNLFQLTKTFFPPRAARPVIVKVIYSFSGAINETYTWFWSESQFYLIQPLEIFQYTSLFFANLPHRQREVRIKLGGDCFGARDDYIEVLTQRMKLYASTTSPITIPPRISDDYVAISASLEEINADLLQSTFLKVWLHVFLVLFPIGSLLCLVLCDPVQLLLGDKEWIKLEDESNHGTIAALIQVSVLFTVLVFILDILAFVTTIMGDFLVYDKHSAFYLSTVTGMLIDTFAFLWVMFVLIKCCHWECRTFWYKRKNRKPCNHGESEKIKKFMSTTTLAPVLCLMNHFHYIILALIADPFHAGGIIVTYMISFGLHYFLFKQFYNYIVFRSYHQKKKTDERKVFALHVSNLSLNNQEEPKRRDSPPQTLTTETKVHHVPFNMQTVVFGLLILAPLILFYEGIIIALFASLPISKTIEDAPSRLYSIYQGTGILIVALLTYNIILAPRGYSIGRAIDILAKQIGLPRNVTMWNMLSDEEKSANLITALIREQGQLLLKQTLTDSYTGDDGHGTGGNETGSNVEMGRVRTEHCAVSVDRKSSSSVQAVIPETTI